MPFLRAALVLLGCLGSVLPGGAEAKTKSWTLYHRLMTPGSSENENWDVRGTIELVVDGAEEAVMTLDNTENALTTDLAQSLTSSSEASFYQLRLVENDTEAKHAPELLTSVPACHVRRANFRDEFALQLHPGTARALSVSYMPLISPLAPPTCDAYQGLPERLAFESKVTWETAVPGMVVGKPVVADPTKPQAQIKPPPGLQWIPGAQRTSPQGTTFADPKPQQEAGLFGFLKRYWYIVLPLMIINLMGAAAPPPEAEGAAAAAAAGAGAATAAAAGGGSPVRQRRGKRD